MIRFTVFLCWFILPFCLMAQQRAFVFSIHKSIDYNFESFLGAHISYNKALNNGWYFSVMGGFRSHVFIPLGEPETDRPRNHIVLDPILDFALVDHVNIDPSITRTGLRQFKTNRFADQTIPIGFGIGKNWLSNSEKFGLFTDVGVGITYLHTVFYGWGEFINFQGTEPPHDPPYFTFLGKSISRELNPHVDIKVESTYFILENLGIGINLFVAGIIYVQTYHQYGIHLRYQY